jgi:hypothetical protein
MNKLSQCFTNSSAILIRVSGYCKVTFSQLNVRIVGCILFCYEYSIRHSNPIPVEPRNDRQLENIEDLSECGIKFRNLTVYIQDTLDLPGVP